MSHLRRFICFVSIVALFAAVGAQAESLVLGADGDLVRLTSGHYGDLFPDQSEADADALVLALEVGSETTFERMLVPGSESAALEESPTLYHDPTVGVTYVLWSSRQNGVHPYLRLVPLTPDGWGDVLDVIGSVFATKFDPTLSVQHDSIVTADGETLERSVLNLLWWEEEFGASQERMKSLVLENGELVAQGRILTLADFGRIGKGGGLPLGEEPQMGVVTGTQDLLVGFTDATDGSLRILSVEVIPLALSQLAESVSQSLADLTPADVIRLEETVFDALVEAAEGQFHEATLRALTDEIVGLLGGPDLPPTHRVPDEVLDKLGPHVIHIGARMKAGGVVGQAVDVVSIESGADSWVSSHHVAVTETARWQLPTMGPNAEVYLSKRGNAALLAWDDGDAVTYRETLKDAWGPEQSIAVTETLDRATIHRILEARALER